MKLIGMLMVMVTNSTWHHLIFPKLQSLVQVKRWLKTANCIVKELSGVNLAV